MHILVVLSLLEIIGVMDAVSGCSLKNISWNKTMQSNIFGFLQTFLVASVCAGLVQDLMVFDLSPLWLILTDFPFI